MVNLNIKIKIDKNRKVSCSRKHIGTIGENEATTLFFDYPDELKNYSLSIIISNNSGNYSVAVPNKSITLPYYVLTDEILLMQAIFTRDKQIWKSDKFEFELNPSLDNNSINIIDSAKSEQKELDRIELSSVLSDITGEDFTEVEWNELIDFTNKLPIQSDQNIIDLTTYSDLTNAFRQSTAAPSLLTGGYNLDKDEDGNNVLIKLPYLYTPNAKYNENTPISSNIIECGFDVSASGNTVCHGLEISMFNRGNSARNLVKLKLTGLECVSYGATMFSGMPKLAELEIIEGENFAESYASNYYYAFFKNCTKLEAIKGTPLDMSRGTTYGHMFYGCSALKYVRFKERTIMRGIDFSSCVLIIEGEYGSIEDNAGTIISILNGIRDYIDIESTPSFKINFPKKIDSYFTKWKVLYNNETKLWEYSEDIDAVTLASAFSGTVDSDVSIPYGKGVELGWVT